MKEQGVTILELILSITLITIIMVGGMQYFQVARQSSRANETLLMIKTIHSAAEIWRSKGLKFSDGASPESSAENDLLIKFAQLGLLTSDYLSDKHHPWGGMIQATGENDILKIQLLGLPQKVCEDIRSKLTANLSNLKEIVCTLMASKAILNISGTVEN